MQVREYRPQDEAEAYRLTRLAFGGPRTPDPDRQLDGWSGVLAEDDAGAAVGFLRFWHFGQFFGGRVVPMGGVASVAVAPHARGRGVASAMLGTGLERMRADGFAVSALYPATPPLYRALGWERVGSYQRVELPTAALPRHRGELRPRPATAADLPAVHDAYLRAASTVDGLLDRAAPAFAPDRLLELDVLDVVAAPDGRITGVLGAERPDGNLLRVFDLHAEDLATARALLDTLARWSGQLDTVSVRLLDPLFDGLLLDLPYLLDVSTQPWMLRVVDLVAAVAARGWPDAALLRPGQLDLAVDDPHAPWQHGRFRLSWADGEVHCEPGGTGAVRLGSRALAAWYAGAQHTSTLRRAGLLDGDPALVAPLDALTGAPRSLRLANAF